MVAVWHGPGVLPVAHGALRIPSCTRESFQGGRRHRPYPSDPQRRKIQQVPLSYFFATVLLLGHSKSTFYRVNYEMQYSKLIVLYRAISALSFRLAQALFVLSFTVARVLCAPWGTYQVVIGDSPTGVKVRNTVL